MAACRLEHDLPRGPKPIKVIQSGPFEKDGETVLGFLPQTCCHCDRPACVTVCPVGAMQKREDGLVFSDPDLCLGCQTCATACPFGVPELNPDTGKIVKCDGCKDRTDQGFWPRCVLACPTEALIYGPALRVVHEIRVREALKISASL